MLFTGNANPDLAAGIFDYYYHKRERKKLISMIHLLSLSWSGHLNLFDINYLFTTYHPTEIAKILGIKLGDC